MESIDQHAVTRRRPGVLRMALRLAATGIVTLVWWVTLLVGIGVLAGAPNARRRWRYVCMRSWSRLVTRLASIRIEVEGRAPLPPHVLVSNHLGYVDVLVLGAVVDGCFVSRGDVRSWPVVGWLSRSVRAIFVDRSRRADVGRVASEMEARLAEGEGIILFPEGTSTAGDRVLPFRPSLFDAAVRAAVPVHFVTIRYATEPPDPPAHRSVCWWSDMEFVPHLLGLLRLRGVRATVRFGDAPIGGSDRKTLAAALHQAVLSRFTPVVEADRLERETAPTQTG